MVVYTRESLSGTPQLPMFTCLFLRSQGQYGLCVFPSLIDPRRVVQSHTVRMEESWGSYPLRSRDSLTLLFRSPLEKMVSQTQELVFPRDGNGHSFPQHIKITHLGVDCFILNSLGSCRLNKSEWPSVELNIEYVPCIHSKLLSLNRVSLDKLKSISLEVDGHDFFALVAR